MRYAALVAAALGLGACDMVPGMGGGTPAPLVPQVSGERVDAFVLLVERLNCRVDPDENAHQQVHTAGFTDQEVVDIGQILVGEGRAEITDTGTLILLTENCL